MQIVFEQNVIPNFDEIAKLNVGSALVVTGRVVLTPQNKQPLEIKATEIYVEGKSTPDYPLQKKRHSVEFSARNRPFASAYQSYFRDYARSLRSGVCFAQFF